MKKCSDLSGVFFKKSVWLIILLVTLTFVLTGCLATRSPADFKYVNGTVVESLSSNASLSYTTPDRSISGSGVLMYRKPDQIRAIILSPFGSVLQEVYVSGELLSLIHISEPTRPY